MVHRPFDEGGGILIVTIPMRESKVKKIWRKRNSSSTLKGLKGGKGRRLKGAKKEMHTLASDPTASNHSHASQRMAAHHVSG